MSLVVVVVEPVLMGGPIAELHVLKYCLQAGVPR